MVKRGERKERTNWELLQGIDEDKKKSGANVEGTEGQRATPPS